MRIVFKILSVFLFLGLLFTRCKKYPDGGLHACAIRNLLTDDNDPWKLKLYEVNGIDSTNLINTGGDSYFYENTLAIFREKKSEKLQIQCRNYLYNAILANNKAELSLSFLTKGIGSTQREILNPENLTGVTWKIERLKKKQLILLGSSTYYYRLVFEK